MKDFDYWLEWSASEGKAYGFDSLDMDCDDLGSRMEISDPSDEELLALEEEMLNRVL